MKKITFLFLISSVLGFSQALPYTFSESNDINYFFKEFYNIGLRLTTDPTDAGNTVAEYVTYTGFPAAEVGLAQTIELAEYIDLSDDNNNTITFRINPLNGTGSGTHLLKLNGGTPIVEKSFTTTGTGWQEVSVDFGPDLGSYRNLIIFLDFVNFDTDTYLIDDIAGGTNVAPPPMPTTSAPAPTISASKVKGVYGETYNNLTYQYNFTDSFRPVDIEGNGNESLEIDLGYYGAAFSNTDISDDLFVHFDYWTTDATEFQFRITSENPFPGSFERKYIVGVDEPIVNNAWKSVFIPLSHYSVGGTNPVNLKDVFQFNFVNNGTGGTIFIDNIYFTSENVLGVNDVTLEGLKVSPNPTDSSWNIKTSNQIISSVEVFDVLGKRVMTLAPNSTSLSIDGYNLKAGLYFAQISTLTGITSSIKLVRK